MGEALSDAAGCCTSRDSDGTEPVQWLRRFDEDDAKVEAAGGGISIHTRNPLVSANLVRRAITNKKGGEKFGAGPVNTASVSAELVRRVLAVSPNASAAHASTEISAVVRVDLLRQSPGMSGSCEQNMNTLKGTGLTERREHLSPGPLAVNADLLRRALASDGCDGIGERYQQGCIVPVNASVVTPQLVRQVLGMPPEVVNELHEKSFEDKKEKSLTEIVNEALEISWHGKPLTRAAKSAPTKGNEDDPLQAGPISPLIISADLVRQVLASDGCDVIADRCQAAPLNAGVVSSQLVRQVLGMPPEVVNARQEKSFEDKKKKSLTEIVSEALERHGQGRPLTQASPSKGDTEDPLLISADLVRRVLASDGCDITSDRCQAAPLNAGVVSPGLLREVLGMPPEDINERRGKPSEEKSIGKIFGMHSSDTVQHHGVSLKQTGKVMPQDGNKEIPLQAGPIVPLIVSAGLVSRALVGDDCDDIGKRDQAVRLNDAGVVSTQLVRQALGMPPVDSSERNSKPSEDPSLAEGPTIIALSVSADMIRRALSSEPSEQREESARAS